MGCDIHLYVEVRKDGVWESVDAWSTDQQGDIYIPYEKRLFTGRNYNLFAMLADVRNRYDIIPISEPKGLPEDISENVKNMSIVWDGDGHSHSHFTVSELLEYDLKQTTDLNGYVSVLTYYENMRLGTPPSGYCGDVGGQNVRIIRNDEMEEKINQVLEGCDEMSLEEKEQKLLDSLRNFYTELRWKESYYEMSSHFWDKIVPKLLEMGSPENVRIVFWFDN
jgi:hypothetical protein